MRSPFISSTAIAVLGLGGLLSCRADSVSSPESDQVLMDPGAARSRVLTVDDDRADCQRADFTTIQEAVDAAEPGSTILVCAGTYREWVVIQKNELRLLAQGKAGDVVLDGQDVPGSNCTPVSPLASQCAGFEVRNGHGNRIEGFMLRRYWEAGIWLRMGSSGNTIRKNVTTEGTHHDGIQLQNSPRNVIEHNTSFANPFLNACGINVAGAESVGNIVRHNETFGNDFGIQVAGGAVDNHVFRNVSHDNRGLGIRTIGFTNGTVIENNRVMDNAGPGIAVLAMSSNARVVRNHAFGNTPDLFWDGTGVNNTFENNHCRTSSPPGLCDHTEGESGN
jgi:parallel beta-helix repeat protein